MFQTEVEERKEKRNRWGKERGQERLGWKWLRMIWRNWNIKRGHVLTKVCLELPWDSSQDEWPLNGVCVKKKEKRKKNKKEKEKREKRENAVFSNFTIVQWHWKIKKFFGSPKKKLKWRPCVCDVRFCKQKLNTKLFSTLCWVWHFHDLLAGSGRIVLMIIIHISTIATPTVAKKIVQSVIGKWYLQCQHYRTCLLHLIDLGEFVTVTLVWTCFTWLVLV